MGLRISVLRFSFFVLGLFLFEEAAETVEGIGGILPLRQCLGGAGGGSAGASKLRLQHASRKTADIGDKLRIGSRAVNQERHSCRTPSFTAASGAGDLSQDAANTASSITGCAARSARGSTHCVVEACHH